MIEKIELYELAPLTPEKQQRLAARVVKLLEMECAVASFESDSGKRVVGVRVINDILREA